jgi:hypothetical protein
MPKGDNVIKNNRHYPYGDYDGYPIRKGEFCPECGNPLYEHNGGEQGGIPQVLCTKDGCTYTHY